MGPFIAKLVAKRAIRASKRWVLKPLQYQSSLLKSLTLSLAKTEYGRLNWIEDKKSVKNFKKNISVSLPHEFESYHQKILSGNQHVLWPGPKVGVRFQENYPSTPFSVDSVKSTGACFVSCFYHFQYFYDLEKVWNHQFLDLSNHSKGERYSLKKKFFEELPTFFQKKYINQGEVSDSTALSLVSGTSRELQDYFEGVTKGFSLPIKDCLPHLSWVVNSDYLGPSQQDWKSYLERNNIPVQRFFSGYGGILAHDDGSEEEGLLLNFNNGFYFEFLPSLKKHSSAIDDLVPLSQIQLGEEYQLVLSNNGGLWRVKSGLLIRVISVKPYRVDPIKFIEPS